MSITVESEFDISRPIEQDERTRKDSIEEWKHYVNINLLQTATIFEKQFRVGFLFSTVMRLKGTELIDNQMFYLLLEILGIPLLTSAINLFIGAISDHWPSKHGRRTSFMYWGLGIYLIGGLLILISGIYPTVYLWKSEITETLIDLFTPALVVYIIGFSFAEIGRNIVLLMFNTYILDQFDTVQQDRVNLMKSFMTGVAYVLSYIIFFICSLFTFNWNGTSDSHSMNSSIDNDLLTENDIVETIKQTGSISTMILHVVSIILMIVGVFCFRYVTKEQEYSPSLHMNAPLTKKECVKSSLQLILTFVLKFV